MEIITRKIFKCLMALVFFASVDSVAQVTIASDGLNNSTTLFTVSGGAYYTGSSATGDRPASSPFAAEGTHSYGVSNSTATLTSSNVNTSAYTAVQATFRLAAFSIASTGNGVDGGDIMTVEVSPNGGTNWFSTLRATGQVATGNSNWAFSATGIATTAYDGNTSPVDFAAPSAGANAAGYSTITITGLPSAMNLRVRITMLNNSTSERWLVDDFKITGTISAAPEMNVQGNSTSIVDGDNTPDVADHTAFGSINIAAGALTRTFTIQNTDPSGTLNLSGTPRVAVSGSSSFTVTTQPSAATVSPSSSLTFVVSYDPTVAGPETATISIANNDSDENPYNFDISGTGTADTATMDWVNLQFPATATISEGQTVTVYTRGYEGGITDSAGQGANVTVWIGYSSTNQNPNTGTWTWVPATYFGDDGANNDEYSVALGSGIAPGTYYYASRWQIGAGPYVYGDTAGVWSSTANNGVLTVNADTVDFANIQFPATATIVQGSSETIYAQVYEPGITDNGSQGSGITAWIGYSAANTNPNTGGWTWVAGTYNPSVTGSNDEYSAAIGSSLAPGTYYYASRFLKTGSSTYVYGGTNGIWSSDSGVLTVNSAQEINVLGNSVAIVDGDSTPATADHTDFGTISTSAASVVRTFTIQNLGGTVLTLGTNAVTLSATNGFSVTTQPATTVATAGSTTFQVTFDPSVGGAETVMLNIANNDANENPYNFNITGTGVVPVPEINVQGNAVSIVDGDSTPSAADDTAFGSVNIGSGNVVKTYTIQNTGTGNLNLDATPVVLLNSGGGFSVTTQPTSPVAPAGSTTFTITFDPSVTTAETNTVLIGSNDADEAVYSFDISGSGTIDAPVAIAATNVAPTSFNANWNAVAGATGYFLDVFTLGTITNVVAWNFPNNPDNATADGGIAANLTKALAVGGGVGTVSYTATGATTRSANANTWNAGTGTKYWEVEFATTGHSNIRVSSKQRSSSTGPRDFKLQYKVGAGGTFADVTGGTVVTADNFTSGVLTNIALPAAADNQPSVYLRWVVNSTVSVNNGVVANTGGSNIDDILVEGQPSAFVSGYNNLSVGNVTTYNVTGLSPESTYYYTVRAVAGGTSANSNTISVTTDPSSVTWNGTAWSNVTGPDADIEAIIAGAYSTGTNNEFTAKKVTVNSGSLTVSSGTNLTIQNELVNNLTAADVVVENNGNLIQVNDTENSGAITVERNSSLITRQDYTLWSSPVADQNLFDFSPMTVVTPTSRFYTYTTATNLYTSIVSPSTVDFATGSGYLIRVANDHPNITPTIWSGSFVGVPNNGDITTDLTNEGAGFRFNLVGNPYASPISIDAFLAENSTNITGELYFWRKKNASASGAYVSYVAGTWAGNDDFDETALNAPGHEDIIQTGQGFIVNANDVPTGTDLVFTNEMRVANNSNEFFKNTNQLIPVDKDRLWISAKNAAGTSAQIAIVYVEGADSNALDMFDARTINDGDISLSSVNPGQNYVIQGRAPFVSSDIVPLSFSADAAGEYTISLDHFDGLFSGDQVILLRDNTNGTIHNLKASSYAFTSDAGTFASRFEVLYDSSLAVANPDFNANAVQVYSKSGNVVVNSGNAIMSDIQIFDLRGRLLAARKSVNASEVSIPVNAGRQMILVKVISGGQAVTKKVMN